MDEFMMEVALFGFLIFLFVSFVITLVVLIRKIKFKKEKKKTLIVLSAHILLGAAAGVYIALHPTSLKYCDKLIIGHSVEEVRERYGEFDKREFKQGEKGKVGYYDHNDIFGNYPNYYWIHYDENGMVTSIECGGNDGG